MPAWSGICTWAENCWNNSTDDANGASSFFMGIRMVFPGCGKRKCQRGLGNKQGSTMSGPKVVIVGGGFGGLNAAYGLRRSAAEVSMIDRRNFHLFQPLLYQVATGGLSPANIAAPLRGLLRHASNTSVVLGEVVGLDFQDQTVTTHHETLDFDYLVIAAGAKTSYFGNDDWEQIAPGLKSVEDATEIRARVLDSFERAELESDPVCRKRLMTFVVVGAGPTGVELAGAISELAHQTLRRDFRRIDPRDARIILVDASPRVLSAFSEKSSERALKALKRLNVEVMNDTRVAELKADRVVIDRGEEPEAIETENVLWAAGVEAAPLSQKVAQAASISLQRGGRIPVQQDLSIAGHRNVFAIGDIAYFEDAEKQPLPGVAPVAIQQGKYVARVIARGVQPGDRPAFQYHDPGSLATIGRRAAVAEIWGYQFGGYFAWLLWALIHILQISLLENRIMVFLQWVWNYITFNRSARLITSYDDSVHPSRPLSESDSRKAG